MDPRCAARAVPSIGRLARITPLDLKQLLLQGTLLTSSIVDLAAQLVVHRNFSSQLSDRTRSFLKLLGYTQRFAFRYLVASFAFYQLNREKFNPMLPLANLRTRL
jgi:hypothetical protein